MFKGKKILMIYLLVILIKVILLLKKNRKVALKIMLMLLISTKKNISFAKTICNLTIVGMKINANLPMAFINYYKIIQSMSNIKLNNVKPFSKNYSVLMARDAISFIKTK